MKRILFTAATLLSLLFTKGQTTATDSVKSRKLNLTEINFVSSYYNQDGNNAAVTGGIGSQLLTDYSNNIDVTFIKYDKKQRKQTYIGTVGVDHYTSASSDQVDLKANSSASYADTRIYPSLGWTRENEKKRTTIGAEISSSTEYDYQSYGGKISFSKKSKNQNSEIGGSLQAYLDEVQIIRPIELRTYSNTVGGYTFQPRNTYTAGLSYSKIINKRLQILLQGELSSQHGLLSLPFHRVFLNSGIVRQENLPDARLRLPLAVSGNYFLGDRIIVKAYLRVYKDDWGINSQTASLELPIKISPFFTISPNYRFYKQTAAKYFRPRGEHALSQKYFTSNYDLSEFTSSFLGAALRYAPVNGVLGMQNFGSVELRYGHYTRSVGLNANLVTLLIQYKKN